MWLSDSILLPQSSNKTKSSFRFWLADGLLMKFNSPTGILGAVYKLQSGIIGTFTPNKEQSSMGDVKGKQDGGWVEKEIFCCLSRDPF